MKGGSLAGVARLRGRRLTLHVFFPLFALAVRGEGSGRVH